MDHQTVFKEVLALLFQHQTFEDSLYLLASYLRRHIPFERLTCYVSDQTKGMRYPWMIVEQSGTRVETTPQPMRLPSHDWSDRHLADPEHMIFLDDDLAASDAVPNNVFAKRRSLLAMSLAELPGFSIDFALTSSLPAQFRREHVELLRIMHDPLAQLAQDLLQSSPEIRQLRMPEAEGRLSSLDLLKRCAGLRPAVSLLEGVASTDSTVLLQGETGVGKELFADALHILSSRKDKPFVRVNCAAITETLLDDAFFGHEKGAFTGANSSRMGFFEQADGGTLFLDEVGELSPAAQARLLRVLETKELIRVGGQRRLLVDVRVVAATHRDLERLAREGRFREDLWYRLDVFPIFIPPLRERREDIATLASWFHSAGLRLLKHPPVPELTPQYLQGLQSQPWPGNARQLRHHIEQALIYAGMRSSPVMADPPKSGAKPGATPGISAPSAHPEPREEQERDARPENPPESLPESLDDISARHIRQALEQCRYRLDGPFGAAARLGMKASTLRSRMRKLGITRRPE